VEYLPIKKPLEANLTMRKVIALFLCFITCEMFSQVTHFFYAPDSVKVTYDEYFASKKAPVILLCHQANYSRGEYVDIAKKINKLGYNCIALDQRSGNTCNNIQNETHLSAKALNKSTSYMDAEVDITEALNFFNTKYQKKIILFGSSYSASLILKIAKKDNSKIKALICFSPGEYFENYLLEQGVKDLSTFTFVYGATEEFPAIEKCTSGLLNRKTFKPMFNPGQHGASVLWPTCPSSTEFWMDLTSALQLLKKI
jgi:pimeloyl-ACP methyl ester carboxylesterase